MQNTITKEVIKYGLFILAAVLLSSCINNSTRNSKAVREFHLSQGKITHINEGHIMILELEHHNAKAHTDDLHDIGTDCYLLKPTRELDNIAIDISNDVHIEYMSIQNLLTEKTITFFPEDNNASYSFDAEQSYEICLSHNGHTEKTQTLFVRFITDKNRNLTRSKSVGYDGGDVGKLVAREDCTGPACDLTDAILDSMDLSDLNLSGAKMNRAKLYEANLSRTILDGTHMANISISRAKFNHTNINTKYFTFKTIEGASFEHASFYKNTTFYPISNKYNDINFNHADLSNIYMNNVHFHGKTTFVGTKFYNTQLKSSKFSNLNMRYADFEGAQIDQHTSFYKADIRHISDASFKVLEDSGANLRESVVADRGDGKYKVRYEQLGDVKFYHGKSCRGGYDTLDSKHNHHLNCKYSNKCKNDAIQSILFYPKVRKNIAIRLYDDPKGRTHCPARYDSTEDYITIYRHSDTIAEPFCIHGLEHDTSNRERNQGFYVNHHGATLPCSYGLNGHVSHIKLVDEDDM